MSDRPKIPEIVMNLTTMINRMLLVEDEWKRLRIAVTANEAKEIKEYYLADNWAVQDKRFAVNSIRGVPLLIEEHPKNPMLVMETE